MGFKLTRIAPTPSGFLHLGNIFSFSLTVALARRSGAAILLRIDDLDRERVQREYVEDIFETLRFMGIPWDLGPRDVAEFEEVYSQVHRMPLYRAALSRLPVFGCVCSRAEVLRASRDGGYPGTCRDRGLALDSSEVCWRLKTEDAVLQVKTLFDGVVEAVLPAEMRDFIVRKKDGFPAYQLSSVVDDLHFGVDLVVRGDDLWASTLAQLYLSYPLGASEFRDIRFFHHRLLMADATSTEKLSKSAGATSIQYLRKQGWGAAAVYGLIGEQLGFDAVQDWEGLADHLLAG